MRELSRTELYSRFDLIEHFRDEEQIHNLLINLLKFNRVLLNKTEPIFYDSDSNKIIDEKSNVKESNAVIKSLYESVDDLRNEYFVIESLSLGFDEIQKLLDGIHEVKNEKNQFNYLLKGLISITDKVLHQNNEIDDIKRIIRKMPSHGMSRVFLSYAYEDHLYTLILFYYFYSKGIYLYIDWLHNDAISRGIKIKNIIHHEMNYCSQLLFLPSINMELQLQGNNGVSPWCAWELGNFYRKHDGQNKYYINIYNAYKMKKYPILDGLSSVENIEKGKIR